MHPFFALGRIRIPAWGTLAALGAAAGLVYSLIEMGLLAAGKVTGMPDLYFESAGMILALVTVGKYLEERSKGKTTGAITALLALAPESAVVRRDGKEVTVPTEDIKAGETVIVRQGGRIPVDGTVTAGSGTVDESALTGESMPVEKTVGGKAVSATILTGGYLELMADRVGADTTLSQIIQLMEQAASGKAPISRLADKISAVFVPVVISIALLAAILWAAVGGMGVRFCLSIAIAVLVISCPCALGLATPVAITVATGKAAEQGVLVKSAASLELMGRVDTVVLDKTGTVTEGKPRVTDLLCAGGMTEDTLLSAAASLEKPSEHPLAGAIVAEAEKRGLPNKKNTPAALPALIEPKNIALMEDFGVLTKVEMESRYEVEMEHYSKIINIEALTMLEMARKQLLPAINAYMSEVANTAASKLAVSEHISVRSETKTLEKLSSDADAMSDAIDTLQDAVNAAKALPTESEKAVAFHDNVLPVMDTLRAAADDAETICGEDYWPLPSYSKMLYYV